jgi:hypothetical protein
MKHWPVMLGLLLLAVGAWLQLRPPSVAQEHELLRVGDWRATVEGRRSLPAWLAPFVLGLGGGALLVGVLRRR